MLAFYYARMLLYASMLVCRYDSILLFASVQISHYARMHACFLVFFCIYVCILVYACLPVFKYASVCRFLLSFYMVVCQCSHTVLYYATVFYYSRMRVCMLASMLVLKYASKNIF